jgi:predicted DNA-binding transcriptional regulator YafY
MRHDKAFQVLDLARRLAGSAEGLTLDEMSEAMGVGRRTVERMRDAVWTLFPQMEVVDDPPTRRFRIPSGLDTVFLSPSAEELAALRTSADSWAGAGATQRADALYGLERKLLSAIRAGTRRKLAPDLEALIQAETIAVQAGARPLEDTQVLGAVREAIKSLRHLSFVYQGGTSPGRERHVVPYGMLMGRTNYLVAAESGGTSPRTWRLDKMEEVRVSDETGGAPEDFSLQDFADQSFGIYQDAVEEVVLRVLPQRADDALRWRFHARQQIELQPDGSVLVRFAAGGMRELAWHLFTWEDHVRILGPQRLKDEMRRQLQSALAVHDA